MSIAPQLSVRRGRDAVEFYKAAFGAVEVYRVGSTDDNPDVVAQLSVGNASFWVSDESPSHANFSPESVGGGTIRMLLIAGAVKDVRLSTVGAVCAIVAVIGFVIGIVLSVSSGVQVLIPETGSEGLDWMADVDGASDVFFAGAWLGIFAGLFGLVALVGFYDALKEAGPRWSSRRWRARSA